MITFNNLYNKILNLPNHGELRFAIDSLEEVRIELERMCEWEYRKNPEHPHFRPYYIDKLPSRCGQKDFNFVIFLKYMFTPYFLETKIEVCIQQEGLTLTFGKMYRCCLHEFQTDNVQFVNENNEVVDLFQKVICLKCGYTK